MAVSVLMRLVAFATLCCLWAAELQGARVSNEELKQGVHSMQAAKRRREHMYSRFGGSAIPKHAHEDEDYQDLQSIKERVLEAAAHDAKRAAAHMKEMEQGKGNKEADDPGQADDNKEKFCRKKKYRKNTMKAVRDAPFIGLFSDLMNITRFEGSSITYAKDAYYVVFDSLRAIGKVGIQFQFRGEVNKLIPEDAGEAESQFEGLQYMASTDTFLAVRESFDHDSHGLVPLTEEIRMNADETEWTLASVCPVKFFGLEDTNKGWEGIHYYEKDNERFLLGLCESNYCKTIQGQDPPGLRRGNGRAILTKWVAAPENDTDTCHWEVVKEIKLPEEAYFLDYAGISFYPDPFGSRVSVVSQEDAAVWVGEFDWEEMEFVPGGKLYHFPRNDDCDKVYCNVEGLTFLDSRRMLFASDRSKSIQPFECMGRDQSVHIMALP